MAAGGASPTHVTGRLRLIDSVRQPHNPRGRLRSSLRLGHGHGCTALKATIRTVVGHIEIHERVGDSPECRPRGGARGSSRCNSRSTTSRGERDSVGCNLGILSRASKHAKRFAHNPPSYRACEWHKGARHRRPALATRSADLTRAYMRRRAR